MFTALLDTCVLYPSMQRDFLLSLAIEGMYRPIWSSAILREIEYVEHAKLIRQGIESTTACERAQRLVTMMRTSFDDAEVHGWEPLEGTYGLPDPDDEHLVAAAAIGGAGAIVTDNVRDLPATRLPDNLEVLRPPEFASNTVALDPYCALRAVSEMASRSGRHGPVRTIDDILTQLSGRYGMRAAVELVRDAGSGSSRGEA